jgi:hypothetical protein
MGERIFHFFFALFAALEAQAHSGPMGAAPNQQHCFEIDDVWPLNSSKKSLTRATQVVNCLINPMNHQVP